MIPQQLLQKYPIISDQMTRAELLVLLRELQDVLGRGVAGDVVELGCYEGTSALFESRMLNALAPHKRLYLYDSFEGLPPKTTADHSPAGIQFRAGQLHASRSRLRLNFIKAGLPIPYIKKAWFSQLTAADLPDAICFAFLDGDFYESIMDSLRLVWPKMMPGGMVVIDDYQNESLPGAAKAVDDFFRDMPMLVQIEASLAIVRNITKSQQ